jgi:metal-responsive CopG/Arc/MetJ family transcriptional regulator
LFKHVSITLTEDLLEAIRSHPILRTVNRSKLVRAAVSDYLERHELRKEVNPEEKEKGV